jgi:hypothetical protein
MRGTEQGAGFRCPHDPLALIRAMLEKESSPASLRGFGEFGGGAFGFASEGIGGGEAVRTTGAVG